MLDEHCTPYDIRESREFSRSPPKLKTPMRFIAVSSPKSEFAENITESIASVYHIKNREIIEYQPDQSIHGCGYSPFCEGANTITAPDDSVVMTTFDDGNMILSKPVSVGYQQSKLAGKDEADIT